MFDILDVFTSVSYDVGYSVTGVRSVSNEGYDRKKLKRWKVRLENEIFASKLMLRGAVSIVAEKRKGYKLKVLGRLLCLQFFLWKFRCLVR